MRPREGAGKLFALGRLSNIESQEGPQGWSSVVTVTLLIWGYVLVSQEEKALLKITKSSWLLWKGRGIHLYVANTGKS